MKNFKKLLFTFAFLMAVLIPSKIFALEFEEVNNQQTLVSAINGGKNVKLTADIENVSELILVDKEITIDLNNYTISFALEKHFEVDGGNLTLTGKGTIKEVDPFYGPLKIYGSVDKTKTNFTTVTVGKDVTLEGWTPIFVSVRDKAKPYAYGVTVNVYGNLVSKNDSTGYNGHALYVNGNIKHNENYPVINVYKGTTMSLEGNSAIYGAGYAEWNIEDVTITAKLPIGIKAGILNLKNVTAVATHEFAEPSHNGNGINPTGAAIQIESNDGYASGIKITIDGGSYTSTHGYAIQHYLDTTTTNNNLESLSINGARVVSSEKDKAILDVENDKISITSGTFSSDVSKFVTTDYVQEQVGKNYVVAKKEAKVDTPTIDTSKEIVEVEEVTIGVKEDVTVSETLQEALKADEKLAEKVRDISSVVVVNIENLDVVDAPKEDVEAITNVSSELKVASFFDITLNVNNSITGENVGKLTELKKELTFNVALPEDLTKVEEGFTRTYYIVRYHDGESEILDTELNGNVLTFATDKFSTYAIAYKDVAVKKEETETKKEENPSTGDNVLAYVTTGILAMAGLGYTALNVYRRKHN